MKRFSTLLLLQLVAVFAFAQSNVTFSVDMSNYVPAFSNVYVSGTFNGWSGNANQLTDMGGGLWETTIPITDGKHDFKFTIDDWAVQESFAGGTWCTTTNGGFVNRLLVVDGDMTYGTVCWDSCVACGATPPSGVKNVTFSVNMSEAPGFTTPYVSGSFNGWSGNANVLTDMGNGVWEGTFAIPVGFHEFKFTADDWLTQENFTFGDPCTVENFGFVNRFLNVSADTTLTTYGWNLCTTLCPMPTNLSTCNLQDSSVTLKWDTVAEALGYRVRYRAAGGSWQNQYVAGNTPQADLTGLSPSTAYRYVVRTNCGGGSWSAITAPERIKTLAMECGQPDSLMTSGIDSSKARLTWTAGAGALQYALRWREVGAMMWDEKVVGAVKTKQWLTGLSAGTSYEWQIKSICARGDGGNSWSALQMFTTATMKTDNSFAFEVGDDNPYVTVFPNPADELINISLNLDSDFDGNVTLVDATGRTVMNKALTRVAGSYTEQLDLSTFAPGIYFLNVQDKDLRYVERVVIR